MAIQMKSDQLIKLLTEMFGAASPELKQATALVAAGHTVNSGLFNFYVQMGEQRFEYTSPAMLAKFASLDTLVQTMIRTNVSEVLNKATAFMGGDTGPTPGLQAAPKATTEATTTATLKAEHHFGADPEPTTPAKPKWMNAAPSAKEDKAAAAAMAEASAPAKPEPKLVNAIIKLSEARAVSQQVKGSSGGSIYRAAAIGTVNVAVRMQPTTISVRAEFQKTRDDSIAAKLVKMGFSDHSSYLSMHIQLDGTPPSRVLGSILYGMDLEFDHISTSMGAINA